MAQIIAEHFDGPNGVTLSTSNTVFTVAENPPVFSTAIKKAGTASAYFNTSGTYSYMARTFSATNTRHWSFYLRPDAAPSANTPIFFVGTSKDETGRVFQLTLNTNRTVKVQEGASAVIVGSATTSALPLNQWSRLDVSYAGGTVQCALYPGDAACDSPVGTAQAGNLIGGAITATAVSYLHIGVSNGTVNQLYVDEFTEDDATVPGPVVSSGYLYYDTGTEWIDVSDQLYYDNGTSWVAV